MLCLFCVAAFYTSALVSLILQMTDGFCMFQHRYACELSQYVVDIKVTGVVRMP